LKQGLDYYTDTVFEFTTDKLGAQATVLAGGRYDGLVERMGGPAGTPGVGWAAGLDRLVLLQDAVLGSVSPGRVAHPRPIAIVAVEDGPNDVPVRRCVAKLAAALRRPPPASVASDPIGGPSGDLVAIISPELGNGGTFPTLRKQLSRASSPTINASHAIIVGSRELASNRVTLKNLDSQTSELVDIDVLVQRGTTATCV